MVERARTAEQLAAGRTRLPPGRHGLPSDLVAENQRERLLNGIVEAVAADGYNATTIGRIAEASRVSRKTFYEHFEGKEDCFLAAYEMIDAHVGAAMLAAAGPGEPWPERVEKRLAALLDLFSRDPVVARFYLVEPLAAGGEIAARYRDAMQLLAELLRPDTGPSGVDAEVRDQALMGGLTTLIRRRLAAGDPATLPVLLPDLVELTQAPHRLPGQRERTSATKS